MPLGHVLSESGAEIRHVYFPPTSCISLTKTIDGCECLEVALMGDEDQACPAQAKQLPDWRKSAERATGISLLRIRAGLSSWRQ